MASQDRSVTVNGIWRMGSWTIDLESGLLQRSSTPVVERRLNRRLIKVMGVLIAARGEVVPATEILETAWKGRVVSGDSISTAIYELRKALGDDSNAPKYIETLPNEGYRLIAAVVPASSENSRKVQFRWAKAAAVAVISVATLALYFSSQSNERIVFVPPVLNSTGLESNDGVAIMFRSRIMNFMGTTTADMVATVSDDVESRFTLESEMIGCEAGPAVIFRLIETDTQRHVWSQHYNMSPDAYETEVLKMAVEKVSDTLEKSKAGSLVFEDPDDDQAAKNL